MKDKYSRHDYHSRYTKGSLCFFNGDKSGRDKRSDNGDEGEASCKNVECFLIENISESWELVVDIIDSLQSRILALGHFQPFFKKINKASQSQI